ncbi:MAG: response regulator transcription factor [Hyphomicrobiales bacterium]|nr:response regulator transcription factor [Hyphomicrobiales bacterium]
MTTIAVIEDDRGVLDLIKDILELEGFDVLPYHDGTGALDAFEGSSPDLVITDIAMPEMDGIQLLRRLREKSDTPVILLTGRMNESDELVGLRIGADDFIRKPFSPRVLVERVRTVLRRYRAGANAGVQTADDGMIERGHLRMDKERFTCTWKGRRVKLSAVEFRLVESLAVRPGTTKSRGALRDILCEDQVMLHERAVDSHIKRLRKKFRSVDKEFNEIETVYGIGYRFADTRRNEHAAVTLAPR